MQKISENLNELASSRDKQSSTKFYIRCLESSRCSKAPVLVVVGYGKCAHLGSPVLLS